MGIHLPIYRSINKVLRPVFSTGSVSGVKKYSPGDSLGTITGAAISTEYPSRKFKLVGAGTDAVITAQAGSTYSINGGTATSDAGTISDGDILRVFVTSSASYETAVTGGVVIGGTDCDFIIETMAEPTTTFDNLTEEQFDALTEEQFDNLT